MRILLQAQDSASQVIKSVGSALSGSGGLTTAMAGVGLAVGAVAVGIGVASVSAATQFQTAMDQNVAHAGLAKDQVNNVTQALLAMGPTVGQSPTALATALYPVLSSLSGITNQSAKSQLALLELKNASESVAGSTTSVTSVTNAASAAFNAYGLQTDNATTNSTRMNNLFDVMNSTVSAGNMQWDAYSHVIGKLSVTSHAAGVSFDETNAALADLTNQGYSAQLGATYLGNTYNTLYTKADTVAKNAKALGLSFDATKYKTMDLGDRIKYLSQVTGGNQTELLKLMGGNSTALKTFDALSNSIGQYQGNLNSLQHSQGATATAFATASSSFGFAMQKVQASGQALLITIGLQLLPILTKLALAVLPIISNFSNWLVKSGALTKIVDGVVNGISSIVSAGANLIGFFQHSQVATAALLIPLGALAGILVFLAVGAIAEFIATLPMIILGLTLMAISAWAAIAPFLVAAAPFILAGIIIGAVIALIIISVQHWGAISKWLQGAWSGIASFFTGIWHNIQQAFGNAGQWFQDRFKQAGDGVKSGFGNVGNWFQQQGKNIQTTARAIGQGVVNAFNWMYAHNTYFKAMVDEFNKLAKQLGDWLIGAWNTIKADATSAWSATTSFITGLWRDLSSTGQSIWSGISSFVMSIVNAVVGWLRSVWSSATSWISSQWQSLSGLARSAWSAVTGVFQSAWGSISGALSGLWSNISGWFSNLGGQMLSYGENLIKSLAQGITNAAGAVSSAASNVASNIEKFLGFHSPAQAGPGAHLLEWPKNMLASYGKAMEGAIPQLQSSLNLVMHPVASSLSGQNGSPRGLSGASGGGAGQYIIVNTYNVTVNGVIGNKNDVVAWIEKDLSQRINRSGNLATTRSGGRASG